MINFPFCALISSVLLISNDYIFFNDNDEGDQIMAMIYTMLCIRGDNSLYKGDNSWFMHIEWNDLLYNILNKQDKV